MAPIFSESELSGAKTVALMLNGSVNVINNWMTVIRSWGIDEIEHIAFQALINYLQCYTCPL